MYKNKGKEIGKVQRLSRVLEERFIEMEYGHGRKDYRNGIWE